MVSIWSLFSFCLNNTLKLSTNSQLSTSKWDQEGQEAPQLREPSQHNNSGDRNSCWGIWTHVRTLPRNERFPLSEEGLGPPVLGSAGHCHGEGGQKWDMAVPKPLGSSQPASA